MEIQEILKSSNKIIKEYIQVLADDYKSLAKIDVCRSCPSDIQNMLNYLKNHYKVVNFELAKPSVIYKLQKGSSRTISNSILTDELAIDFLKIRKERIELFSKYPSNWLELIGESESEAAPKPKRKYTKRKPSAKKTCKTCKQKKITKKDNADE